MIVYKYLSEQYALEALQEKRLKVGRLTDLNDPADCRPVLINSPKTESKLRGAFARKYFSEIYDGVGVVCYCEITNDPVVWSHYADSHRGMALGYNVGPPLLKVEYQPSRPTVDYNVAQTLRPDGKITGEFITQMVRGAFTKKAVSWSYEKEYRHFVWLARCEMIGSHYFLKQARAPEKIVLGVRCKLKESDVKHATKGWHTGVKIVRAKLAVQTYDVVA